MFSFVAWSFEVVDVVVVAEAGTPNVNVEEDGGVENVPLNGEADFVVVLVDSL